MEEQEEESIQLVTRIAEEYDNYKVMAKYWRSKSLPVVCMPPPPLGMGMVPPEDANYFQPLHQSPHAKPALRDIRESSEDSEGTATGRGTRNSSIRSDNTNNTLLTTADKVESERKGSNSSGQVSRHPQANSV